MIRSKDTVVVLGVLATSTMLLAACNEKPRSNAVSTTHITSETIVRGDVSGASSDPRQEYVRMARGDLDNLERRIALLEARPAATIPAEKGRIASELRESRSKLRELRTRVDAVSVMPMTAFEREQTHLQSDWDTLGDRIDRLAERLSEKP